MGGGGVQRLGPSAPASSSETESPPICVPAGSKHWPKSNVPHKDHWLQQPQIGLPSKSMKLGHSPVTDGSSGGPVIGDPASVPASASGSTQIPMSSESKPQPP